MASVSFESSPSSLDYYMNVKIEKSLNPDTQSSILREALVKIASDFAAQWLEENKDKVIERLNVDAIANIILLEVAKQTKNDILEKK